MNRELDPNLFHPSHSSLNETQETPVSVKTPSQTPYLALEVKDLKQALLTQQRKMQDVDRRLATMESHVKEAINQNHLRIEKMALALQRLEAAHSQSHREVFERLAQLQSKVNERRVSENRIEELFDRQNLVFQSYENRLAALQKLISDKEMQLMNYSSALRETRQELLRLKR